MNDLENLIEAILFYRGEPVTVTELAKAVAKTPTQVESALSSLAERLNAGGTRLVKEGNTVALATAPEASEIVAKLRKEEFEGPLGKAGLETLAIVIYQGPVSRADIEYVRGVNCTAILRSLMMRGLIERVENSAAGRSYLYRPTVELPAALGVSALTSVPFYEEMKQNISAVIESHQSNDDRA